MKLLILSLIFVTGLFANQKAVDAFLKKDYKSINVFLNEVKMFETNTEDIGKSYYYLGLAYLNGEGVEQNKELSNQYFLKSSFVLEECSNLELSTCQFYLSSLYLNGYGVIKDTKKAKLYLDKSVANNNIKAIFLMVDFYTNGNTDLKIKPSFDKQVELYKLIISLRSDMKIELEKKIESICLLKKDLCTEEIKQ